MLKITAFAFVYTDPCQQKMLVSQFLLVDEISLAFLCLLCQNERIAHF